jgi:hypothetical protein
MWHLLVFEHEKVCISTLIQSIEYPDTMLRSHTYLNARLHRLTLVYKDQWAPMHTFLLPIVSLACRP